MHTLRETAIRNVASGENVVIYQPANLYDCTLGDILRTKNFDTILKFI